MSWVKHFLDLARNIYKFYYLEWKEFYIMKICHTESSYANLVLKIYINIFYICSQSWQSLIWGKPWWTYVYDQTEEVMVSSEYLALTAVTLCCIQRTKKLKLSCNLPVMSTLLIWCANIWSIYFIMCNQEWNRPF